MKKILISLLILFLTLPAICTQAQEITRHEISASYGIYTANEFANLFGSILSFGLLTSENQSSMGAINVAYAYRFNKVISLGGTYTYSNSKEDLYLLKTFAGTAKYSYHSIMPTVKFNWLNRGLVSLYSKVAAGINIASLTLKTADENGQAISDSASSVGFGFQVSPIGIEIGRKFAVFAEAGVGCMGTGLLGIRLRF